MVYLLCLLSSLKAEGGGGRREGDGEGRGMEKGRDGSNGVGVYRVLQFLY
jgi:hypothetical protein